MEHVERTVEANAPGRYYVAEGCNGCGICYSIALQNFMYNADASRYFILSQPEDPGEEHDILEAMALCPMECIHDDGLKVG